MMFMARKITAGSDPFTREAILVPQIWPAIAHAMVAEVRSGATEEQAHGFFSALGQRIAAMMPVDDIEDINALSERVNLLWSQLGWGHVSMALNDDGVDLRHDGVPHMPSIGDDDQWLSAAGPLLAGAYDSWFRTLGSNPKLRTHVIHQADGSFEFRHAP